MKFRLTKTISAYFDTVVERKSIGGAFASGLETRNKLYELMGRA